MITEFEKAFRRGVIVYEDGKFYRHWENGRKTPLNTMIQNNKKKFRFLVDGYDLKIPVIEAIGYALTEDITVQVYPIDGNWKNTRLDNIGFVKQESLF